MTPDPSPSADAEVATDRSAGERPDHLRLVLLVGTVVAVLDQLTKWWALEQLDDRTIDLIGSLRLNLVFNSGTAFSIGDGSGALFAVIAAAVSVALVLYGRRVDSARVAASIALVMGGAVGNLIDRAVRSGDGFLGGRVVDFVDLQWWPVFNLADAAIVCGSALLILASARSG